jgi:hypothetical protein
MLVRVVGALQSVFGTASIVGAVNKEPGIGAILDWSSLVKTPLQSGTTSASKRIVIRISPAKQRSTAPNRGELFRGDDPFIWPFPTLDLRIFARSGG